MMLAQKIKSALTLNRMLGCAALFLLPTLGVVTAFGIAPETSLEKVEQREIVETMHLPSFARDDAGDSFFYQDKVQRGDTVAAILARLNVNDPKAFEQLKRNPASLNLFRQLRPGRTIQVSVNNAAQLVSLRYYLAPEKFLEVTRDGESFSARDRSVASPPQLLFKSATIRSSLFAATDEAGIPDAIATQVARIFSTDIDFHLDLRRGDRLSVVYEMQYENGELVRPGRVLSAEFTNDGRVFDAFLFADEDGSESYYSRDGQNRAKSFLRSPLEFSRVSSGFGARFHPIFKNWRAHTGVDFAAPKGTRIWATADGIVEFAGVRGGYGNCIEVRHSGGVTTLYGHLSAFAPGIVRGKRIQQGQAIGFVGATGWATGPHLHYEFRIGGSVQDPLRVALPKADPLPERLKPAFRQAAGLGAAQLALLRTANFGQFE